MPHRTRRFALLGLLALILVALGPVGWAAPDEARTRGPAIDLPALIERIWSAFQLGDGSSNEEDPAPQPTASAPPAAPEEAPGDQQEISPFIDPNG